MTDNANVRRVKYFGDDVSVIRCSDTFRQALHRAYAVCETAKGIADISMFTSLIARHLTDESTLELSQDPLQIVRTLLPLCKTGRRDMRKLRHGCLALGREIIRGCGRRAAQAGPMGVIRSRIPCHINSIAIRQGVAYRIAQGGVVPCTGRDAAAGCIIGIVGLSGTRISHASRTVCQRYIAQAGP